MHQLVGQRPYRWLRTLHLRREISLQWMARGMPQGRPIQVPWARGLVRVLGSQVRDQVKGQDQCQWEHRQPVRMSVGLQRTCKGCCWTDQMSRLKHKPSWVLEHCKKRTKKSKSRSSWRNYETSRISCCIRVLPPNQPNDIASLKKIDLELAMLTMPESKLMTSSCTLPLLCDIRDVDTMKPNHFSASSQNEKNLW